MNAAKFRKRSVAPSEAHWIPLSDLMTGLMVIFLLIAVTYMMRVEKDAATVTDVAVAYSEIQDALYEDLNAEFGPDLSRWKAAINKSDLSIRFDEPDILFQQGQPDLNEKFESILQDFLPRYVAILTKEKYSDKITEVRIEGHTSSEWTQKVDATSAYFLNMELSQARTRSVLIFAMKLPALRNNTEWLKSKVTANGLSSSRLVKDSRGNEDSARSRRVEFRVRTDAEVRLAKILALKK